MKKRTVFFAFIFILLLASTSFAATKDVGFSADKVTLDNHGNLWINGWIYNVGNTLEVDANNVSITVRNGKGQLIGQAVINDEKLQRTNLSPGHVHRWGFTIKGVARDSDLTGWTVTTYFNSTTRETFNFVDGIKVFYNNNRLDLSVPPIVRNGRTLVPLRGIFENMGAVVAWDSKNKTIVITKGNIKIKLFVNSTIAWINDTQKVQLDVAPTIIDGSTYVPLRFISQAMGGAVFYGGKEKIVAIGVVE